MTDRAPPLRAQRLDDLIIETTWLYYHDSLSQNDIATRLGISRASVVNYLAEARTRGYVRVSMDPDIFRHHRLAQELKARFGLVDAIVVPADDGDPRQTELRVAIAAGTWLPQLLQAGDRLGVSWGETIYQVSEQMPYVSVPGMSVVQLLGARPAALGFAAETCTANIARRLGALCVNLHAPLIVSEASLAARLRAEPVIAEQLAAVSNCNKTIFAAGSCKEHSHIVRTGIISAAEMRRHVAAGAKAVICGRLIDGVGRSIATDVEDRMIGVRLDQMRGKDMALLVSSGSERTEPMLAALRGGFATHIATCTITAQALLDAPDQP